MDVATERTLRSQLEDRRQRLERTLTEVGEASDLVRLLREVDSALKRMDGRAYGSCEVCGEEVEREFLLANPLVPYCLCNLSPQQQAFLQTDLDLASRVQWSLLPKQDLSFAVAVHFRYEPQGAVSGDYCDLVANEADGGSLYFLVGDVSGKGVASSFVMAHLNATFRSLIEPRLPVEEIVQRANRLLIDNRISSHYATLVCGRAGSDGQAEVCNAGHCPPLLLHGGEVGEVRASGLPIGLFGGGSYTVSRLAMEPGDTLLLYTDGLAETRGADGTEFGAERLAALLREHADLSPPALAAACLAELGSFGSGTAPTDDLTLLVLQRL